MANLFSVSTSQLEKSVEEKFVEFFEKEGIAWSHWLPNSWLLATKEHIFADYIQSALRNIDISAEMLIVQVDTKAKWSGALFKSAEFQEWIASVGKSKHL